MTANGNSQQYLVLRGLSSTSIVPAGMEVSTQAAGSNAEQSQQAQPAAANQGLHFQSVLQVFDFLARQRPSKEMIDDGSFPFLPEQQAGWVKAILVALRNVDNITDGPKPRKVWQNWLNANPVHVEVLAWKFLNSVMEYHSITTRLEPHVVVSEGKKPPGNFADHMNVMLEGFRLRKTLCKSLSDASWTRCFIDAPGKYLTRVVGNQKGNSKKTDIIKIGKAAIVAQEAEKDKSDVQANESDDEASSDTSNHAALAEAAHNEQEVEEDVAPGPVTPSRKRKLESKNETPSKKPRTPKTARTSSKVATPSRMLALRPKPTASGNIDPELANYNAFPSSEANNPSFPQSVGVLQASNLQGLQERPPRGPDFSSRNSDLMFDDGQFGDGLEADLTSDTFFSGSLPRSINPGHLMLSQAPHAKGPSADSEYKSTPTSNRYHSRHVTTPQVEDEAEEFDQDSDLEEFLPWLMGSRSL